MTRNKESMLDCQMGFAILTGLFERMRGLKDPALRAGTTVVLAPCRDIHTVGMAEAVDVAFVDKGGVVVGVHRSVPPREALEVHSREADNRKGVKARKMVRNR